MWRREGVGSARAKSEARYAAGNSFGGMTGLLSPNYHVNRLIPALFGWNRWNEFISARPVAEQRFERCPSMAPKARW